MMCCYHSMLLLMWDTMKTMLVLSQNKPLSVWLYSCVLSSYWDCIPVHADAFLYTFLCLCALVPQAPDVHIQGFFCCMMKDVLFPATSSSSDIILVLWTNALGAHPHLRI